MHPLSTINFRTTLIQPVFPTLNFSFTVWAIVLAKSATISRVPCLSPFPPDPSGVGVLDPLKLLGPLRRWSSKSGFRRPSTAMLGVLNRFNMVSICTNARPKAVFQFGKSSNAPSASMKLWAESLILERQSGGIENMKSNLHDIVERVLESRNLLKVADRGDCKRRRLRYARSVRLL